MRRKVPTMTDYNDGKVRPSDPDRTGWGDARPDNTAHDPRAKGSRPQEKVEDRDNVSMVKPEDYPKADREISQPK